ncbi:MAG TPA: adenylosuccinate lyase [Opitutales bacterium]|jgi:adenylosuccinate lyase|nr:adenylosuccinate lyase [Opitutales bacterium]
MEPITNVLASRYASEAMRAVWSPHGRILLEREFWIAVLKAQRDLGLPIPETAIADYERVKEQIDLESIRQREQKSRHDVKARIDEFCALAGHEHIHKGLTSRDLTESVEEMQVYRALELTRIKAVAALVAISRRAGENKNVLLTARTHNVPAQLTTMGKRLAMFGEELLLALEALDQLVERFPVRGLKGAVGTQLDQLTLFRGDVGKVIELEGRVLAHLGIRRALIAPGQVYPRSIDFAVISALYQLGAGPSSFAKTLRLMASHDLAGEGFAPNQVGSSAMPHKMNSRSCERLNGLHVVLRGYLTMAEGLAGDQWNEGDVSCSVVRRVMLPDAFFAIDGLLETMLTILAQMEVNQAVAEREVRRFLPFLSTTTVLMEVVKAGVGRETAHEIIKEHAVATARDLRSGKISENDLFQRLVADARLGLDKATLERIARDTRAHPGSAAAQVDWLVRAVLPWRERFPAATDLKAEPIL